MILNYKTWNIGQIIFHLLDNRLPNSTYSDIKAATMENHIYRTGKLLWFYFCKNVVNSYHLKLSVSIAANAVLTSQKKRFFRHPNNCRQVMLAAFFNGFSKTGQGIDNRRVIDAVCNTEISGAPAKTIIFKIMPKSSE